MNQRIRPESIQLHIRKRNAVAIHLLTACSGLIVQRTRIDNHQISFLNRVAFFINNVYALSFTHQENLNDILVAMQGPVDRLAVGGINFPCGAQLGYSVLKAA